MLDFIHFVLVALGAIAAVFLIIAGTVCLWDGFDSHVGRKERDAASRERRAADDDWKDTMRQLSLKFQEFDPFAAATFLRLSQGRWHATELFNNWKADKAAATQEPVQAKRPRKAAR